MNRIELKQEISRRLDGRRLIWFGTRGDDIEAATELEELHSVFSILAPHRRRHSLKSVSLEDLTGIRVDLDTYDLDEEPNREAFAEFRQLALHAMSSRNAVFTYRPSVLVSSLSFARQDRTRYLGMFKDFQSAFEHKPWVESSVAELGVPAIPWRYIANEDQVRSIDPLGSGSVMLRRSRSTGGTGLYRAHDMAELRALWPQQLEAYVSVAPYLEGALPINVSGVVWHDGVTLHPMSVQLIGIDGCSIRPFGFCGNDFATARDLDGGVIDAVQQSTLTIGEWMRRHGYRGAFGIDFLLHDGQALFAEINPRFQGSTHLSCEIALEMEEGCLVLDHLGAHLGLDAPPTLGLRDFFETGDVSHLVQHWTGGVAVALDGSTSVECLRSAGLPVRRSDVVASPDSITDPGGTVARTTFNGPITATGFELTAELAAALRPPAA